jgi:gas vesicle protein
MTAAANQRILAGNRLASIKLQFSQKSVGGAAPGLSGPAGVELAPKVQIKRRGIKHMSTNQFAYFGIGAALGAAAAILLAPKSGPETRKFLRSKAEESADFVASRAADARDTASQAIHRGKKALKQNAENLTAAVDAGVQTYREAVQTTP